MFGKWAITHKRVVFLGKICSWTFAAWIDLTSNAYNMIMQEIFSKASPRFPNFEASNTWQMGHNSREGFFFGQELLLDFALWNVKWG